MDAIEALLAAKGPKYDESSQAVDTKDTVVDMAEPQKSKKGAIMVAPSDDDDEDGDPAPPSPPARPAAKAC